MDKSSANRGMKILGVILLFYGLLVATHKGEFWPFSIYPMFSQAGKPWTRAIVLDVTDVPDDEIWNPQPLSELSADPVPIGKYGIDQIDYSNFMSKTTQWTETRKNALRSLFGPENIGTRRWLASKALGKLTAEDSMIVMIQPFLLVTADSVYINPQLSESDYFKGE